MTDYKQHAYKGPPEGIMAWQLKLQMSGVLPPATVVHCIIEHDDGCPTKRGGGIGTCTCKEVNAYLSDSPPDY